MRGFLIGFPATLGVLVLLALALPTGEVVTLETVDADGRERRSALWIVEIRGVSHLRAGSSEALWLERLKSHPRVVVERNENRQIYRATAVDTPDVRRAVNEAIATKYGLADRLVRSAVDVESSVPVRLEPSEAPDVRSRP